jgi:hypothetical protein
MLFSSIIVLVSLSLFGCSISLGASLGHFELVSTLLVSAVRTPELIEGHDHEHDLNLNEDVPEHPRGHEDLDDLYVSAEQQYDDHLHLDNPDKDNWHATTFWFERGD